MPKKKPKDANEMTDEQLIKSVFPAHVVARVRRELGLDERAEESKTELKKRAMNGD